MTSAPLASPSPIVIDLANRTGPAADAAARPEALPDIVRLLGGDVRGLRQTGVPFPVAMRCLAEDVALAHEGDPLHCLHVLRSGSLKCVRTLEDGYEQVTGIALPGDVLGFDALYSGQVSTTLVSLEPSSVYTLPLGSLAQQRLDHPALDQALQLALSRQLARATQLAEMLAAVSSGVRLARFLLYMSAQSAERGWSARRLRLRIGRRDIGSLLGMAHETVSRSFTALHETGMVKVANREVEIVDLAGLRAMARWTRAPGGHGHGNGHGRPPAVLRDPAPGRTPQGWCSPVLTSAAANG